MSPLWAALILTWAGLGLLYLAMLRLLVELRGVRREVAAVPAWGDRTPVSRLPELATSVRLVVVADRDCPFCRELVDLVASRWGAADFVVLVHGDGPVWRSSLPGLQVIEDAEAWRSFAPLTAPILVVRDAVGQISAVLPPANLRAASAWLSKHEQKREKIDDEA
ncbi:hypothetical protein [Pimelobacter simplex]|uniref:hypothetical protein n=1 Tax=Nocardioides simplex TaxID=2045 RepID=UPI003AAC505E